MRRFKWILVPVLLVFATGLPIEAGDGMWTTTYPNGGHIRGQGMTLANGRLDLAPNWRGLYASNDGAATWTSYLDDQANTDFDRTDITGVLRGFDNILYIIARPWNEGGHVLYASNDDGATWNRADSGLSGDLNVVGFDPSDAQVIYAGNREGNLWKTTDGTVSWSLVGSGLPGEEVRSIEVDPVTPATVYVGTIASGLFRSTDGGATFTNINNNVVMTDVVDIAVDPSNPLVAYAADNDPTTGNGLFRTADGGTTWTKLAPVLHFNGYLQTLLAFDPNNANTLYAGSFGELYKTIDGGVNWTSSTVMTTVMTSVVIVDPATPSTLYVATSGEGVFRSTDAGLTWSDASNGLEARNFLHSRSQAVHFDASTPGLVYTGGEMGGWRSSDNGATWTRMNGPIPSFGTLVTHPSAPGVVWATTNDLWRSNDNGLTWSDGSNGAFCCFGEGDVVVHPGDASTLYVASTDHGVWKTTDGGTTWNLMNNGLGNPGVRTLGIDPNDGNVVYAGAAEWNGTSGIWKTTDGGNAWFQLGNGLGNPINPNRILVHPVDSNTIVVGSETTNGGVYISTDGGNSWWQSLFANVNAVAADPGDPNRIYAGTWNNDFQGFFRTLDGGATWTIILDGLPIAPGIESMTLDPANANRVLIGTTGGAWEYTFAGTVTLTVTNFEDSGPGTLRDAMQQADQDGVPNVITFAPGMAGGSLSPQSPLPALTEGNTTLDADLDNDCVPDILIVGWSAGGDGIQVLSSDNVIEGLVIHGFDGNGVLVAADAGPPADNNLVVCNYIGPDIDGIGAVGNGIAGVHLRNQVTGNQIGAPGQPNVISANHLGLHIMGVSGNIVEGNLIGEAVNGDPLGNHIGVLIQGLDTEGSDQRIGPDNVIAHNYGSGIQIEDGDVLGVRVAAERNTITRNTIHSNGDLGIRLSTDSPLGNDPGDVDIGPNTRLNTPESSGASDDGGGLFTVSGTATADATVELFAVAHDPSGFGEGMVFLADGTATGGAFNIQVNLPGGFFAVTATATDTLGNTSEFSANLELVSHDLTITNANDTGPGSLRHAIEEANSDGVSTNVTIDPGLAGQTIFLLSPLPDITEDATYLDADFNSDCVPDLELDGGLAGWGEGFRILSSDSTVRGFVINLFPGNGVQIEGARNVVDCNYIGTEPDGESPAPNGNYGVSIFGSDNVVGPDNVIAHNNSDGVNIDEFVIPDAFPDDYAGLVPDFTGVFPVMEFNDNCAAFESVDGIRPLDGSGAPFTEHFGARFTGTVDVDTGGGYDFQLQQLDDRGRVIVDGNVIVDSDVQGCCDPSGHIFLNAGSHSIVISFEEGGGAAGFRFEIHGPGTATLSTGGQPGLFGELFQLRIPAERNTITQNAIFDNGGLGIAFNCCCGPTQNDPGDVDVGANTVLNFPELSSFVDNGGGSFTVDGTAPPDSTVEIFGAAPDPSGFGEGKAFVASVVADPAGQFSLLTHLPAEFASFTATATDTAGNSSEFSANLLVKSPDEVNVGFAEGFQGDTVEVPIFVRDLASTPLGGDQPVGNRIQGFTFQVQFQPQASVQAISAFHSGVTAGLSPLFDTFTVAGDTITYIVSFDESTDLVPLVVDTAGLGDEVARLVVTIDPGAAPNPIGLALLGATALSNQGGTLTETQGAFLAFGHGSLNVRTRAATALHADAISQTDVRLRWNDPQVGETGFRVERSDDGGGFFFTVATVGPDDTEYIDGGLVPGFLYFYRVIATNGGDAPPSNLAWAETFPASSARICVQQVSDDHTWMRFPSPAYSGSLWATSFYERTGSIDEEVFFQFIDANANPTGAPVQLSDNDMRSRFPTLRFNGTHFGVLWTDHMRGPGGEVTSNEFLGLVDVNGQIQRTGVRLFDQVPLGGLNNDLELTYDWDGGGWGRFVADLFSPPSTNLGFWRFSEDGEPLTGPVQLSFTTGSEGDISAVWNGSVYGAAWLHHDGATHEVLFRRFLPDGTSPDPGTVVVWQAAVGEDAAYSSLVWNGAGWAVAWTVVELDGSEAVYLRLLGADGTPAGPARRLSPDEDPAFPGGGVRVFDDLPELVQLPGGGYACYTSSWSSVSNSFEIGRLEADAAGLRVGTRTFVSDEDGAHSVFAKVATDGNDHLVPYNEHRQGGQETAVVLVDPAGSVLSGPNDLSCCHSPGNVFFTSSGSVGGTAALQDGFLSLVSDEQSGVRQLYAQVFDGAGNPAASYWPLSGRDVNGLAGIEGLGDTFAVAWKDGAGNIVFARYFADGSGSLFGEVELANGTGGRGTVALAFGGDYYGVVYFSGNDVVLQRVDQNGGPVGGPVVIADNGRQIPQVQWTGSGWSVVWRGPDGLYYGLVDLHGAVDAGPVQVTPAPPFGSRYDLVWSGEHLGLVWVEDRGVAPGGGEIYFNVLALDGTPTLADVLVASPTSTGFPQLYWSGDRFHLLRATGQMDVDGTVEDEILPDGTVFSAVRRHTNRGAPGFAATNGTTMALQWGQLQEVYLQTDVCLADPTPPDCPDLAVATGPNGVDLDWTAVSDAESTTWRYNLYRDGVMLAELFPTTQFYADAGFRPGSVHDYEVRALNGAYQESLGCPVLSYSTVAGDGNGDGVTDVVDIFYLIQFLFAGGPAPQGDADANGDGVVDVADVFFLVNFVFGGGPPPLAPLQAFDVLSLGEADGEAGGLASVPLYIRDLSGTPLGGDGTGGVIQGFGFRIDLPAEVTGASFVQAGGTADLTPIFPIVQATSESLTVLMSFAGSDPLGLALDAAAPGDLVGRLELTVDGTLSVGTRIELALGSGSVLVNGSATLGESASAGTLSLVPGGVTITKEALFTDGFETGDTSEWSRTSGGGV